MRGVLTPSAVLAGHVCAAEMTLKGSLYAPTIINENPYPDYEGATEITPRPAGQTLETAEKVVHSDITIKEIPYAEVTNPSGGMTITIGGK